MNIKLLLTVAPGNLPRLERALKMAGLAPISAVNLVDVDHEYSNGEYHSNPVHYGDEILELTQGANSELQEMGVTPLLPDPRDLTMVQKASLLALLNQEFLWKSTTTAAEAWWAKDADGNLQAAWDAALERHPEIFETPEQEPQLPDPALGTPSPQAAVACMLASLQDGEETEAPSMFLQDAEKLISQDEEILTACVNALQSAMAEKTGLDQATQDAMWEQHQAIGQAILTNLSYTKTRMLEDMVNLKPKN